MGKIVAVGEILIDLIGTEAAKNIRDTHFFEAIIGGSPANFIHYMALFGEQCQMIASVGRDDFGEKAMDHFSDKIDVSTIRKDEQHPTSVIFLNKTTTSPTFISYRQADSFIFPEQFSNLKPDSLKLIHTTAFALSQDPAQSSILAFYQSVANGPLNLSIDFNYSEVIWNNHRALAQQILMDLASWGAMIKVSKDDVFRLYEKEIAPETFINDFLEKGAKLVCYTDGKNGAYAADQNSKIVYQPSNSINVVDATGAGDSFWAAFLHEYLKDHSVQKSLAFGSEIAEKKLQITGPLQKI